jgi:hypothetical protein
LHFEYIAGNMTIYQTSATGTRVTLQSFPNSWGRGQFFEFDVELTEDELRMYRAGNLIAQHRIDNLPPAGGIVFFTNTTNDIMRIDDCLFLETVRAQTEESAWAFERLQAIEPRRVRPLLSEWYDDFDDRFRTREWWVGGVDAPGQFQRDATNREHSTFLRMTGGDGAVWRMFNSGASFYAFGRGQDTVRFFDSSDVYLRVNVRIPDRGTAWIAARAALSRGGGTLDGFYLLLTRLASDEYLVIARAQSLSYQRMFYEGPLPLDLDRTIPEWITLLILTYNDRVAFFANGRFLGEGRGVPLLSGTVAIGVEGGTVADFDDFQLRDASPETR